MAMFPVPEPFEATGEDVSMSAALAATDLVDKVGGMRSSSIARSESGICRLRLHYVARGASGGRSRLGES